MQQFFKQFSFPGGIGSHCTPETPGSIHEGGELGLQPLARVRRGVRQSRPDRRRCRRRRRGGDRPARDGVALEQVPQPDPRRRRAADPQSQRLQDRQPDDPRAHRREELESLFVGYGWTPYFVEGSDPMAMHQKMAATLEDASSTRSAPIQKRRARRQGPGPPALADDHPAQPPRAGRDRRRSTATRSKGFWRSHQVPFADVRENQSASESAGRVAAQLQARGTVRRQRPLIPELRALAPRARGA